MLDGMIVLLVLRRLRRILLRRRRRGYGRVVACPVVSELRVDVHVDDFDKRIAQAPTMMTAPELPERRLWAVAVGRYGGEDPTPRGSSVKCMLGYMHTSGCILWKVISTLGERQL